jgi:ABC-2 type transport system ATP-binding protein
MDLEPRAELEEVHKKYGKTVALAGLDLEVRPGELLALLGPNGAGKTTAISLLLGLQRPDAGRVHLFGLDPRRVEARRGVGVMMQEVTLPPELRVREMVDLAASYYPMPLAAREALALTHTTPLAERPYGKLSGGQKRQAQFAVAVCGRPRLLFLDEPTVGLDLEARETMWATLRSLIAAGTSIVLTTHYLEEAEALADRVAVLVEGRLAACGSVDDIRAQVARKRIVCATTLDAGEVGRWPGVESAERERGRLHITARHAEAIVRRLLAADANVEELEVHRAGLAEAFTALTSQETAA